MAVLSRGYGRSTTGYLLADEQSNSATIGDEPLQIHTRYPDLPVAVDGNRRRGIEKLFGTFTELRGIILDDAFQHRYVIPGISILLTSYDKLYIDDYVLPTGYLREFRGGSKRADIIVVTKAPRLLSPIDRRLISQRLSPKPYQKVYFSYMSYQSPTPVFNAEEIKIGKKTEVVLVTGIAKPDNLFYYLKDRVKSVKHIKFRDHHNFEMMDIMKIKSAYDKLKTDDRVIITTEKDAMRLRLPSIEEEMAELPLFYIPLELQMHDLDKKDFDERIEDYVRRN